MGAGVRGNEEGNYLLPDMPDYPEGYPRQTGFESKKQTQKNKDLEEETDIHKEKWVAQMIQFMENHDFEKEHLEVFEEMFCDGDCSQFHGDPETKIDATDIQVQLNTWRRTEAIPLGKSSLGYRYLLEFHEAPSSYRGFFFEVQFQGPDSIHGFEFTSEVHILPEAYPFEDCQGET